jgi:hypothetical protein
MPAKIVMTIRPEGLGIGPSNGMALGLRGNDLLLETRQQPFPFCLPQSPGSLDPSGDPCNNAPTTGRFPEPC